MCIVHEPRKSEVGVGSFVGKIIFFLAKVQGCNAYLTLPYFTLDLQVGLCV